MFDGGSVALVGSGRPDFGPLQTRMKLTSKRDVEKFARNVPVQFVLSDALQNCTGSEASRTPAPLSKKSYRKRREALSATVAEVRHIYVQPACTGNMGEAIATLRESGWKVWRTSEPTAGSSPASAARAG